MVFEEERYPDISFFLVHFQTQFLGSGAIRRGMVCPSVQGWPKACPAGGRVSLAQLVPVRLQKAGEGIFSPGFSRSQRSFILGDAGHIGTGLATAGPLGCRAGRLQGREGRVSELSSP